RIETRARNARSALFPDASGARPSAGFIAAGEPGTRMGPAPHRILLAAVRAQRLPARLSHSAGRYLCNFAYWRALAATQEGRAPWSRSTRGRRAPGGGAPRAPRRQLTSADVARAGEAILMALIVAARARRRQRLLMQAAPIMVPLEAPRRRVG